jgi:hypothetical protein
MSFAIEAPPESPGHVGHTPQPFAGLGLSLGRLHDRGGIFGSGVVRALLGLALGPGTLAPEPAQEYAMQPFGVPGGRADRAKPPKPEEQRQSRTHTLLQLEESSVQLGRSGRVNHSISQGLMDALDDYRTWKAPR